MAIDELDRKILRVLSVDARVSHQDLAERVGLSPTPCARRIRKLEADQIITGYGARIDAGKLGFGFSVFVSVKLDQQVENRLVEFEKTIRDCPEIVDCWLMTGSFDYLMLVLVSDLAEYEQFLTRRLTRMPGVASIESSVPIRRVKEQAARLR
ncbi:transcriptional regulator, AsnC family [Celeribacter baekdonensis]|uniref:Transcriptional regulator, AsnC family n=1 Tax=Celeribacter baekdonensis TaxID=875171 RepID=A0A1G7QVD6_9RHOB|nr:transcriptional regulator, AsnC family [Celeribacter baekdonensis]